MPDGTLIQAYLQLDFKDTPEELVKKRNILDGMSAEDRERVGFWCLQGYKDDKTSREKWEKWYAEAIKLTLQVKEAKTFPWPNCANVKFPLLTIAALNAHAQAYAAIISGDNVVKGKVIGLDPDGKKLKRAERVGKHMSYQLLEEMPWEEQTDKQLLVHYIMGTTFKKTYRDNARRCNASDLVMPQDLIINYFSRDIDSASRVSHYFTLSRNELQENIRGQVYVELPLDLPTQPRPTGPLEAARDKAQKLQAPPDMNNAVHYMVEQCCWMDLDQDGFDEPYAVTFDEQTGHPYRIAARYYTSSIKRNEKGQVTRITPECYYTQYTLIPSPDGGIYGLGLGLLLAPINAAVDTLINQMLDAGTMKILGGGFLGRGVRMKAGETAFKPYEWKPVDSTGDDLRKNIVPNQIGDIPTVLLDLLKYLVEYGERIGSAGDIQMGKIPGQNVKAETMAIANENGKLIFNSTFKRFWRSMKDEFKKLYKLNQIFQEDESFQLGEKHYEIQREDYKYPEAGILPAADPNIVSRTERKLAADMVFQTAASMGGAGHDMEAVIRRKYEAYDIPAIETIFPGYEKKPPQPNPKMIEAQIKQQREKTRELESKGKIQVAIQTLQMKARESQAKIMELIAKATKELAEAKGVEKGHQIALLDTMIGAEEARRDDILETAKLLMDSIKDQPDGDNPGAMGGVDAASGQQGGNAVHQAASLPSAGGLGQ